MSEKKEYKTKILYTREEVDKIEEERELENHEGKSVSPFLFQGVDAKGKNILHSEFIFEEEHYKIFVDEKFIKCIIKKEKDNYIKSATFSTKTITDKNTGEVKDITSAIVGRFMVYLNESKFDGAPYYISISAMKFEPEQFDDISIDTEEENIDI